MKNDLLEDEGNLQQEDEPEKQEEWKVVVRKKPKKVQKKKAAPKTAEKPSSALKGKRKIFCFDCKGGRTYIVDSGASFHLVSRANLSDREVATIVALDEPIPIQTANGEVDLSEKCEIFVIDLKVKVWAYILPDTVAVLSLGLLVEELGYSYIWNPGKCPILRKGNLTVRCHPMNNVPFIYPGASVENVPKVAGGDSLPPKEQADTDEDKSEGPPELLESSESEGHVDEEDVPKVRSRP